MDLPHLFSPGPASVNLDDLSVSRFGPQEPSLAVVAMEMLRAADLEQLIILRFIWEVKGPQSCLLQDTSGSAHVNMI